MIPSFGKRYLRSGKVSRITERYSNIIELSKYFRISYDKAMEIANIPGFPRVIFMNEKPFPKAQIAAWAAQRLDPQLLEK